MYTKGSFGYRIGEKLRLMQVQDDADMLWMICIREICVLLQHYGSTDGLRQAFDQLIDAEGTPTLEAIEKHKVYTDLTVSAKSATDWYCLTRHCQHSFINILDTGYFLNNGSDCGLVLLVDFNANEVRCYDKDSNGNTTDYNKVSIAEIRNMGSMPDNTLTEIVIKTKNTYEQRQKQREAAIDAECSGKEDSVIDPFNERLVALELNEDQYFW